MSADLQLQRPTISGKVDGIVGWEPLELQCRECGSVFAGIRRSRATDIILSGYHFHICDGRGGRRRCPACLDAAITACPSSRCKS